MSIGNRLLIWLKKHFWHLLILLIGFVYLCVHYSEVLFHPNTYLFAAEGDSFKNYFCFQYHVVKDASSHFFSGMNYPNGDWHIFTDGMLPLANFLRLFPSDSFMQRNAIGIFNLVVLLSVLPATLLNYSILKHFNVRSVVACVGALIIGFLSPQWLRLEGHYSLSLQFCIPFIIWANIRFTQRDLIRVPWRLAVVTFLVMLFITFSHAYLGAIGLLITLLFQFCYNLLNKSIKKWQIYVWPVVMFLLPIILYQVYSYSIDDRTGRPANPSGIYHYIADFQTVFTPSYGNMIHAYNDIFNLKGDKWEGYAFIGTITTVLFFFLLSKNVRRFVKWPKIPFKRKMMAIPLLSLMITGVVFLIVSFSWVHLLLGNELIEYLGPLKQIRALGRFAWVFYFAATFFAFYLFDRLLRFWQIRRKLWFGIPIIIASLYFYLAEVNGIHEYLGKRASIVANPFQEDTQNPEVLEIKEVISKLDLSQYNSIMPIPYFHIGGEYISTSHLPYKGGRQSLLFSYYSNLKCIGSCMGRTSVQEAKDHMVLLSPTFYKKPNYPDSIRNKKILVIASRDQRTEMEDQFLKRSKHLFDTERFGVYEMGWNALLKQDQRPVDDFKSKLKDLTFKNGFWVSSPDAYFFVDGFDGDEEKELVHSGSGAISHMKKYREIGKWGPNTFRSGVEYEMSIWVYNAVKETKQFFLVQEKMPNGELKGWTDLTSFAKSNLIDGDWSLVKRTFWVADGGSELTIVISNMGKFPLTVDDMMIREKSLDVYQPMSNDILFYNNHFIRHNENLKPPKIEQVNYAFSTTSSFWSCANDNMRISNGVKRVLIGGENLYVAKFEGNVQELNLLNAKRFNINGKVNLIKDGEKEPLFVVEYKREGETYHRISKSLLSSSLGEKREFNFRLELPGDLRATDQVKAYFFNPGMSELEVMDLSIQVTYFDVSI